MISDVLNNEIKKCHDLIKKRQDDFLLSQIAKISVAFVGVGAYVNPDVNQFTKDLAPFLTIKTTQGNYENGMLEITSKLVASEYLKAFMSLELFDEDGVFK